MMLFTKEDVKFIKEYYPKYGPKFCSEKLGKTPHQIKCKANYIGIFKEEKEEKYIGKVFTSNECGDFLVTSKRFTGKNTRYITYYKIKFLKTGYEKETTVARLMDKAIKDPYFSSISNKGFWGNPNRNKLSYGQFRSLYCVWVGMLRRCYDIKDIKYEIYGKEGVFVDEKWFDFSIFLDDVQKLPNWDKKLQNWKEYTLDKDVLSEDLKKYFYSKNTCKWATYKEQRDNSERITKFKAISPLGQEFITENVTNFAKQYNFYPNSIYRCLSGNKKSLHGWKFIKI